MGYLIDFEQAIANRDTPAMLRLWEEYTSTDELDAKDLQAILEVVKASELSDYIGRHIERCLPLWERVEKGPLADDILRLIVDLEVTENPELRKITIHHLEEKFSSDKFFNEKMRLIGFRSSASPFKGAISQYLLLSHMEKGQFVFHSAGWGVGEIMDVSILREQLSLEFDYAPGRKELAFKTALSTLIPIPNTHFLAQRFGNPDALEEKAKKHPVETIQMLLQDLGPQTAAEIKDELCELVIPEKEWSRWWQNARAKVKKDTCIESPADLKRPFRLRKEELPHEERLKQALEHKPDADTLIQMVYSFIKDFAETLENKEFKELLIEKMKELVSFQEITTSQELQIYFLLQDLSSEKSYAPITELIEKEKELPELLLSIPIQSFRKRTLEEICAHREDWKDLFLDLLFRVEQSPLRDYIYNKLIQTGHKPPVEDRLRELSIFPQENPELTLWYFQKIMPSSKGSKATIEEKSRFFEALLILLFHLEQKNERRDLVKKIHSILSSGRFAIVRKIMKEASIESVKEILLLVTKCHSLADHDIKTFHSLAEVAHPSLKTDKPLSEVEEDVIWTTQEGYGILQSRIEQIGTVETVDNAKEIEVARAHGDLRENAEFKAALERRDRIQAELKFLSDQLNKCRILTTQDITTDSVGIGTTVHCTLEDGEKVSYTVLGPWDADPDQHILSFQSKLAKRMQGLKKGGTFELQGKILTIESIELAIA